MPPFLRSRIRRRIADAQPSGGGSLRYAGIISLLLLPSSSQGYLGPTHCTKPGVSAAAVIQSSSIGYSTFNHLLFDVVSVSTSFQSGLTIPEERLTFKICPGTVIDLDDSSLPLGFLPIEVPRLTLQCGDDGRRGSDPDGGDRCVIRGGGKRDPKFREWNMFPGSAFKNSASGILGGGSVAQIYVYGEGYEITLKGLTFDNSLTAKEANDFVAQFGKDALGDDDVDFGAKASTESGKEKIEEEYDDSVPTESSSVNNGSGETDPPKTESSSVNNGWGGANQLKENQDNTNTRNLQEVEHSIKPAHRFASVAVRGKGYGDDAGPRLITIEDCRFDSHRGYAILVSPGIRQPDVPMAPEFEFPQPVPKRPPSSAGNETAKNTTVQSSGQINNGYRRKLNLLENGGNSIPVDGRFSYYDHAAGKNYHDGRRVKISKTEFANNRISGENVAGLITSAYSLTMTNCFFQNNAAKAMVFVYNNDALVDNTVFAKNKVEVSTVIMASPKGSKPAATAENGDAVAAEPTHIVERTCFIGSHVGMSNVLVTDVEDVGFGQRDNHASGTDFTWVSTCEGGAAEQLGHDCLETGNCDGTCVQFTSNECMADRVNSLEYKMFFNSGNRDGKNAWASWMTLVVAAILGTSALF